MQRMKNTTIYRLGIVIILLAFWSYCSGTFTENPDITWQIIPVAVGLLTATAI